MHERILVVGGWLRRVVQGHFNYDAVPGNVSLRLSTFRKEVLLHSCAIRISASRCDSRGGAVRGSSAGTDLCAGAGDRSPSLPDHLARAPRKLALPPPRFKCADACARILLPARAFG